MTQVLELSGKDFKATIIAMHYELNNNRVEMNKKDEFLEEYILIMKNF